ncbi:MAG: hypothetical protein GY853_10050 [PVC group bacterium]|nr:hypothetical protein [PVC group bacterium]
MQEQRPEEELEEVLVEENCCKMYGKNCMHFITEEKCNSLCDFYNSKEEVNPEELDELIEKAVEKPNIKLEHSTLPKFDKLHEFFVMKNHVFLLQSVSPKKIILKFSQKLKDTDSIGDGCYTFKNQKDELLEPRKVFLEMKRKTKHKTVEQL